MTLTPVSADLLHGLVRGAHAEGTTTLAVAAAIEADDRLLLIAVTDNDFDTDWQLPADLVLPGETLLDALHRAVELTTGLDIDDVTGYHGHRDDVIDADVVRTFVFAVTAVDPERLCRTALVGHDGAHVDLSRPAR
jgi:ADP-ribose pyrophosphatase YjhB (NUDIX family)